jgi:hypothetical protein
LPNELARKKQQSPGNRPHIGGAAKGKKAARPEDRNLKMSLSWASKDGQKVEGRMSQRSPFLAESKKMNLHLLQDFIERDWKPLIFAEFD